MKKRPGITIWLRMIILVMACTFFAKPLAGTSLTFHESVAPDAMLVKRLLKTRNDNDNADERSARQGQVPHVFFQPLPAPQPLGLMCCFCALFFIAHSVRTLERSRYFSFGRSFLPAGYYTIRLGKLLI